MFLLTGLGAAAAILMLVFKDTIMSLVASIQISIYDMVRVGDWLVVKQYGADAIRWFILSDSPPEKDIQWSERGVNAAYKFVGGSAGVTPTSTSGAIDRIDYIVQNAGSGYECLTCNFTANYVS